MYGFLYGIVPQGGGQRDPPPWRLRQGISGSFGLFFVRYFGLNQRFVDFLDQRNNVVDGIVNDIGAFSRVGGKYELMYRLQSGALSQA